ncbi:MAG: glutathione S-transferase [Spirochaeta sp.]|nr:glutathione S-transferase [Spirochaeta sp.]RPG05939.1 MAG: glutathione S-transferase family protein [Proteobacteria bacterium TMED72]
MPGTLKVYGASISYYTGKLEGYLRYKEIPYEFVPFNRKIMSMLSRQTGTSQMPAVELPDGRFMTDTTPMIDFLESAYPEPSVIPPEPVQGFMTRLVEDYAEEWLWRPAMHYRWSYRKDALLLSRKIVDEIMPDIPLPGLVKRWMIRRRQHGGWVRGDGVTSETWDHVEGSYLKTLDQLEAIFASRPYLLGEAPTLADFGFFASIFRHFSQDPTASDIMRVRAPHVFEWQARLWNERSSRLSSPTLLSGIPEDWGPILDEIGSAYLPYLCDNARAWKAGEKQHTVEIQGVTYRKLPTSQYRVWCLERLQAHFRNLPKEVQPQARARLESHGCWEPLFRIQKPDSRYDEEHQVPFRGRKVHYQNAH